MKDSKEEKFNPPSPRAGEEGALPLPKPQAKRNLSKDFTSIKDITIPHVPHSWW